MNYTIQPFATEFFFTTHVVMCGAKTSYSSSSLKYLGRSDGLLSVNYAFDPPQIKIFRRSLVIISQAVASYKRSVSFKHSKYWRICMHFISVPNFNMEVTTMEQWDGCAAQVALRSSDIS